MQRGAMRQHGQRYNSEIAGQQLQSKDDDDGEADRKYQCSDKRHTGLCRHQQRETGAKGEQRAREAAADQKVLDPMLRFGGTNPDEVLNDYAGCKAIRHEAAQDVLGQLSVSTVVNAPRCPN
jgi:hypothetical protein